jgi:hypothetical protein
MLTQKFILFCYFSRRTWISWPLAFILRSGASGATSSRRNEDVATLAEKEVSMR